MLITPNWDNTQKQTRTLFETIRTRSAARVGETAVVSSFMHTFDPSVPDCVGVVVDGDAGRVFYGRAAIGQVLHIDVFHEIGEVDHKLVATWVRSACEIARMPQSMDLVDIQTGTGGGRATGSLGFGLKPSLRRAHLNHVHLATEWREDTPALVPWLVFGVENAIMRCGLGIRKVSQIGVLRGSGQAETDLSPYSTPSDSWLKGDATQRDAQKQVQSEQAMALFEEFGGIDQTRELFDEAALREASPASAGTGSRAKDGRLQRRLEMLADKGYAERAAKGFRLNDKGWQMYEFLSDKSREIELQFKRLLSRCDRVHSPEQIHKYGSGSQSGRRRAFSPVVTGLQKHEWASNLAICETVIAAAARSHLCLRPEPSGPAPVRVAPVRVAPVRVAPARVARMRFVHQDLRVYSPSRPISQDVCLLIDASASMSGKRMRAAKYLARHLLLTAKAKVSVVVFREGGAEVEVAFTRDFRCVQSGLERISPAGLTPLADGIVSATEYIAESGVKKPLLLLITDGIPTVPKWSLNPIEDALVAAAELPRHRIKFGCVGLAPNRTFLQNLARRAAGALYILEELEKEALAGIARRERVVLAGRK